MLAKETAEQIRKKAETSLTNRMHVHVKGVPRKQEIEDLRGSDEFRAALAEVLAADALYQDCITLNMQPGSLLVDKYKEDEEAYDAVADACRKRITSAARKYNAKKEKHFLKTYDIDTLIAEVRGRVTADFIRNMKQHLRNDRLAVNPALSISARDAGRAYSGDEAYEESAAGKTASADASLNGSGGRRRGRDRGKRQSPDFPETGRGRHGRRGGRQKGSEPLPELVTPDTYDAFALNFAGLIEPEFLAVAGYQESWFGGLLVRAIEERHDEIAALKNAKLAEVWNLELSAAGRELFGEMKRYFSGRRLFDLVSRNRYVRRDFEGLRLLRAELVDRVPESMPDLFPLARSMERHFIIHIGPTNSGKTYSSVERLKTAESGIYLGPLRLLAYEQYRKLNEQGYPCSLYTGEEHQLVPGARLQASTIEMADERSEYEVAVIDEAQMVADTDRGWAWTTAVLGLRADEIHVCIAPYAEEIITSLIEECGDTYEIVRHERQTPLVCDKSKFKLEKQFIHKHDALIVFSRRNVHAIAGELKSMGISCSVIYGNLPYDVRQEEARRFREGETDVVVATDAIGMGMNLPIERLVFLEISKFDGRDTRLLLPAEIQQIVGRAGRRGIYDIGFWNSMEGKDIIESAVETVIPQIEAVYVGFPESLINIEGRLSKILTEWRNIEPPEGYIISALEHEYELCCWLEERTDDKHLIYRLITIPFDEDSKEIRLMWNGLSEMVLASGTVSLERMGIIPPHKGLTLTDAEQLYKQYDLAYAFIEKFGDPAESEVILAYKKELSGIIAEILKTTRLPFKKCKYCGRKLKWNYPYGICAKCYAETRGRRKHHWDRYY